MNLGFMKQFIKWAGLLVSIKNSYGWLKKLKNNSHKVGIAFVQLFFLKKKYAFNSYKIFPSCYPSCLPSILLVNSRYVPSIIVSNAFATAGPPFKGKCLITKWSQCLSMLKDEIQIQTPNHLVQKASEESLGHIY